MEKALRIIQIIVSSLFGLPIFVMTTYNVYRQEINLSAPPLIEVLPDWHWAVWLSILLFICLILLVLEFFRRSLSNSEVTTGEKANATKYTQAVNHSDLTQQSGRDSLYNSNNTNWSVYLAGEDRTKKDLRLQIGVELQVFGAAFQDVVEAKHRDLRETLAKSDHIFKKIKSDLLYRANLLLTDTRIPANLIELAKYYDKYSLNVLIHHTIEEKIHSYLIGGRTIKDQRSQVPQELDDEAQEYRISADADQITIQVIIADTLKLCKE